MAKTHFLGIFVLCLYFILTNGSILVIDQPKSIECGNLDYCPAKLRLVASLYKFSIVLSEYEIDNVCSKLTHALECYNDYRTLCINETLPTLRLTDDYSSASSRRLILVNELCNTATFKQDYVTFRRCQRRIQADKSDCMTMSETRTASLSDKISKIVEDRNQTQSEIEQLMAEAFVGICCTNHQFSDCVYKRSLDKCGLSSAEMWRKIWLDIFNRINEQGCDEYSQDLLPICVDNSSTSTILN